jgi:hypothetical protein
MIIKVLGAPDIKAEGSIDEEHFNEWAENNKNYIITALDTISHLLSSKWMEDKDSDYVLKVEHKLSMLGSQMKGLLARRKMVSEIYGISR